MKYIATSVVSFGAGAELGLTKAQAASRQAFLSDLGKGWYIATGPVQFKIGEEFRFDGDLPKSMAADVEALAKAKSQADAEAKAKAEAEEKLRLEAEEADRLAAAEALASAQAGGQG